MISASAVYDNHRAKILGTASFVLTYLLWASLSYFSTHLYAHFCADWSVMGFFIHPFMVSSPHCRALRWFVVEGSTVITHLFAMIAAYVATAIVTAKRID
jgi:hypothetical protein